MSANASLTIVGGPQRIEPGRATTLTAQIVNLGTIPDDFRLSVRDIDPAWVTFRPPTVYLKPGEQATAAIVIAPPLGVSPQALRPIFRLLSRRAGNVAIVEIAMPAPRAAGPPVYQDTVRIPITQAPPVPAAPPAPQPQFQSPIEPPPRGQRRKGGALPLVLGVGSGLLLVALLVGVGAFVLARRDNAPAPTATAETAIEPSGEPSSAPSPPGAATAAPPTATRPSTGKTYVVANTGGDGVYLRRTPSLDDRDTAYPDNTRLVQIGPDVQSGGITWHQVRTPDGKTGYVPAQYTQEAP